ncbi:GNAT family N-acetyltransferase [Glycomyces harbinensis]|uniref:Putative acetyltransferase n=1 Tax=Glycomyces harbinensis TaxID=58114 RepID=A0A1G7AJE2_9ACTN|nr:N-acetyltransferase [Glycomyces harbinensis]SDE13986.1 putative acetyltransferase [Glycomyces harbinensis]
MTVIRRETEGDAPLIHAIHDAAFATTEHSSGHEADLVDALRTSGDWVPEYSLVAEADGKPVGHVVSTYGRLAGERVLGLGPIGVDPALHGKGIGSALMHAAIGAAEARNEPAIVLLGSPELYGRFGFGPAAEHGVEAPDPNWGAYFQIRLLTAWRDALRGTYAYSPAFNEFG